MLRWLITATLYQSIKRLEYLVAYGGINAEVIGVPAMDIHRARRDLAVELLEL